MVDELPATATASAQSDARRAMIDSQLRTSGINAPTILAAFAHVAREDFVPADRRAVAYADRAIPLDGSRVLAPAVTHGQMLQAAGVRADDTVLVIGGATGYLAALVGQMARALTVVEAEGALAARAPARSGAWHEGALGAGWAAGGPYSLILVDGAIERLPDAIAAQLAPDGRLVTGLVERGVTRLAIGRRNGGTVAFAMLGEADFAPLAGFAAPKRWSF